MTDFEPTEEESKALDEEVKEMLANAKTVTREEAIEECLVTLNKYCKKFNISSYHELMSKADIGDLDIPGDISADIVWAYTKWFRLVKESEEGHEEEARKLA
ncbi:MAG: hypothetical protein OXB88_07185 [Bacteriovoracales bacterium]|nr:hypothetical protein [Bacteriovoracales bacterium]